MKSQKRCISLLAAVILSSLLYSQSTLQQAVDALARSPELRHAGFGVCVLDVESGALVAGHDPDRSLTPASTLKVLTTASALAVLGADYRYPTELQIDGMVGDGGRLSGNLYLRGSGDPTLGSGEMEGTPGLEDLMERFRLAVQQRGIKHIDGHVVGDGTALPTGVKVPSWQWNDLGNYYAAGSWGLNLHENLYYLRFQQNGSIGAIPSIAHVHPEVPGLTFHNEVKTAGRNTGDNAYIYGGPYTTLRYLRGTIPAGSGLFSIKGSLPDPPLFAAHHMAGELEKVGIRSEKGPVSHLDLLRRGYGNPRRTTLMTHYSPPLRDIVARANGRSVNLYCESLLRTLGMTKKQEGTLKNGLRAVAEEWQARGVSFDGVRLYDGSGLSSRNVLTARFLATVLLKTARDPRIFQPLYDSLPDRSNGNGSVRAKSGTLGHVRAYAGYARDRSGRLLSFALIANNFDGSGGAMRRRLQQLMLLMAK